MILSFYYVVSTYYEPTEQILSLYRMGHHSFYYDVIKIFIINRRN